MRAHLPQRMGGRFGSIERRVLGLADRNALHELLREHSEAAASETDAARDASLIASTERFGVGCFVAGELVAVGFCLGVGARAEAPFEHALFVSDFVKPSLRRRGLSSELHAARLHEASLRGAQRAFAWVDPRNTASVAGFERMGFERMPIVGRPAGLQPVSPEQVLLARAIDA